MPLNRRWASRSIIAGIEELCITHFWSVGIFVKNICLQTYYIFHQKRKYFKAYIEFIKILMFTDKQKVSDWSQKVLDFNDFNMCCRRHRIVHWKMHSGPAENTKNMLNFFLALWCIWKSNQILFDHLSF